MSNPYKAFFKESEPGKRFMVKLDGLITAKHEAAEKNPEHARDYSQRAKGIREVIGQINTLSVLEGEDDR